MSDWQARAVAIEAENEQLRDRLAILENVLGLVQKFPPTLPFTPSEGRVVGLLMSQGFVRKEAIFSLLYDNRPNEIPEPKIVDVFICKIRAKLKKFTEVRIETKWGEGYYIPTQDKPVLRKLIEEGLAACGTVSA